MSECQYSDPYTGVSIQIYNEDNVIVGTCYFVAYTNKEKKGRLALRKNIALNFDELGLKILLTGSSIHGNHYQTIHDVVFDQDQEFIENKQITFTLSKVSDWSRTKTLNMENN